MRKLAAATSLLFLATSSFALAQTTNGGWRRATDPPTADNPPANPPAQTQQADPAEPVQRGDNYGRPVTAPPAVPPQEQQAPPPPAQTERPAYGLPATLYLKAGTYVSIRTNQMLSSDHNTQGETFSGTLMQPLVVNGVVVAERGQTVYGQVAVAQKAKAGHDSQLGLTLTGITLADGTQLRVTSQLVSRQGPRTPGGVQAGTVVGTTAAGAAIGGIAGYGTGAAIGAGAGALVGIAGVMLTRNHPTILYPETALTFQMTTTVAVSTSSAPQAFRFVGPEDYNNPAPTLAARPGPPARGVAPYPYAPYPYGPGYYPSYPYPYAYGPYIGPTVVIGGGWGWGGGWGYGRRWR
jgi:hypothetical protein